MRSRRSGRNNLGSLGVTRVVEATATTEVVRSNS